MKIKIILVSIAISALIACNSEKKDNHQGGNHEKHDPEGVVILSEKQREALDLQLGNFQMRNLTTVVKINGQLDVPPASRADITAIIGGNVKEIRVFHGDKVRKGHIIAILEHPDYIALQEDFLVIASRLEFLEKEYERQKELFENNVGAGRDYQQARADYNTAKARYQGLESRLQLLHISTEKVKEGKISNTVNIISPINGYVNEINIKVGTYVGAKDKLFEITDNSAIHADFMVYEKDVYKLKMGQIVHFTVASLQGKELTATIFAIGKEFDTNSRAVHIHAKINGNTSGIIPGMYISGHLHTDEKYTRTLPNDAVVGEGTKSYIFIRDDSVLKEQQVAAKGDHEENSDGQKHGKNDKLMAFRMVEVITGQQDNDYSEIHLLDSFPENTQIVMNAAYYLLADMNKEETEHDH